MRFSVKSSFLATCEMLHHTSTPLSVQVQDDVYNDTFLFAVTSCFIVLSRKDVLKWIPAYAGMTFCVLKTSISGSLLSFQGCLSSFGGSGKVVSPY